MAYIPGHSFWVGWALETTPITESTDGVTPPTIPAPPSSFSLVGYTNVPDQKLGLNNGRGRTIGIPTTAYKKRGTVTPSLSFELRAGSLDLLENINRQTSGAEAGRLPQMCFWAGVVGKRTYVYRYCKMEQLVLNIRESQAEASEITAQMEIWAQMRQRLATPLSPNTSLIKALGDPLYYNDIRVATQKTTANAASVNLRRNLMGLSATLKHNLERKSPRENFGDNVPASRTSSDLLEHLIEASGELTLHDEVPASLIDASQNSLDWGDLQLTIANAAATKTLALTLYDLFPGDFNSPGMEPSGQLSHTVPFTADDFLLDTTVTA